MDASAQRRALLAPPALLVASALLMAVVSPFAWGAASGYEIPNWMTTASGLAFAAAGALIGGLSLRSVLSRTRHEFRAFGFHLIAGTALTLFATVSELYLAARITLESTYTTLRDEQGRIVITPTEFGLYTVFGIVVISLIIWAGAYLYCQAISDTHLSGAAVRPVDEPDAIGEILRSR